MSPNAFEVHMQMLLAVGLAVFCFCLVLGCILCWRRGKKKCSSPQDKEAVLVPYPSGTPVEQVTVTLTPSVCSLPIKHQYEPLEGDVLEFPTPKSSSSYPSEDDLTTLHFDPSSPMREPSPRSCFPMRRLSTPAVPCNPNKPPNPPNHGRASLPSIPKMSLVSKTRRALDRRSTVCGDSILFNESSRLTPVVTMSPPGHQVDLYQPQYGSSSLSIPSKPVPLLHFSLLFSPSASTLCVNILGLSGGMRRRSGVFVRASLPPLCPSPQGTAPRRRSLSPELQGQSIVLQVGSVDELRGCTLRLEVYSRDFSGLREAALGLVEMPCGEMDWEPDTALSYTKELSPLKNRLKKSLSSQDSLGQRRSSTCTPRTLGQLFILLQYQTLAQRIKVMVRKAENLVKLTRMPGVPDHYVIINLRQGDKVIGTKETKGAGSPNPVWNAPFLFDLPSGDITQLPLVLEFIVMQGRLYTKSSVLGRVLIGGEAPEAGQGHWKDMCSRGQMETARWHTIQSAVL